VKFEVLWISLEKEQPHVYAEVWVTTKDGKVSRDARVGDTYFGSDRLKWLNKGFQDLAEYHKWSCNWVTHWAKYIEPEYPDAPQKPETQMPYVAADERFLD
jgi:hypothetical protein